MMHIHQNNVAASLPTSTLKGPSLKKKVILSKMHGNASHPCWILFCMRMTEIAEKKGTSSKRLCLQLMDISVCPSSNPTIPIDQGKLRFSTHLAEFPIYFALHSLLPDPDLQISKTGF